MALLSPGVEIAEIDASTIVPTASNTIGVFCGHFHKGPVNQRVLITDPNDLIAIFGEPTDENYNDFFQVFNFLQYQNTIYVVRVQETNMLTASGTTSETPSDKKETLIQNWDDFELKMTSLAPSTNNLSFFQASQGVWANGIEVQIQRGEDFGKNKLAFDGIYLDNLFEYYPEKDILDSEGNVTVKSSEIQVQIKSGDNIETFLVSTDKDAKDSNSKNIYVQNVINKQSELVYCVAASSLELSESWLVLDEEHAPNADEKGTVVLDGASDGVKSKAGLEDAYELFSNKDEVDIDIVIGNEDDNAVSQLNLVDYRKDCIAFYGVPYETNIVGQKPNIATARILEWRLNEFSHNTMFQCLAGNYKYQYDKYNDKNRWVNLQGDIQGLRQQTNTTNAQWWASAGLERGQIKNVLKLAFIPSIPQRDQLYKISINPVTTFPGMGTVMWGQKTLLSKPSSFDRVNVRGLFNSIERSLAQMSKFQVFEFNDEYTRNRILQMINPFLESVQSGRGIQEFLVVCDTSNNTPDVISRNQLVVDVYIKPSYQAEYISLRFHNQGVNDFSTLVS